MLRYIYNITMVKINKNLVLEGLIGAINKQFVLKQYGTKTIIASYPDMSRVVKTEKQKKENSRFALAVAYAKSQMANPVSKAEYLAKAAEEGKRAYNLAISDFYTPPEITRVDLSAWKGRTGDPIYVFATDDFRVERVGVEISDSRGVLQETAASRQVTAVKWECLLQKKYMGGPFHVKVSAWDRPGNVTVWDWEGDFGSWSL